MQSNIPKYILSFDKKNLFVVNKFSTQLTWYQPWIQPNRAYVRHLPWDTKQTEIEYCEFAKLHIYLLCRDPIAHFLTSHETTVKTFGSANYCNCVRSKQLDLLFFHFQKVCSKKKLCFIHLQRQIKPFWPVQTFDILMVNDDYFCMEIIKSPVYTVMMYKKLSNR